MKFVIVSGVAALANFLARIALSLRLPFPLAVVGAYGVGLSTAFVLNRRFVFAGTTNRLRKQVAWFFAVNLLGLAQTFVVSVALAEYLLPALDWRWHPEAVAHAIGLAVPAFTSYLAHARLSFRRDPAGAPLAGLRGGERDARA
ncbi:MAG TPA: GtrA family protein [Dokdonella sp.]